MSETRSWSAEEFASTGFMKRGVPITPSEINPPRKGMLTIRDLLMLSSIDIVLMSSIATSATKTILSFFEKVWITEFIWSFVGNLPAIFNWRIQL